MITQEQFEKLKPKTKEKIEKELTYNTKKAIEAFDKEYPKGVELIYIDYSDQLSDEQCQEYIHKGFVESLWGNDWFSDSQYQSFDNICKELATEDLDEENMKKDEEFREYVFDKDISNPEKDLLHNTRNKMMYYDLEFEVMQPDDLKSRIKEAKRIAKRLKIDYEENAKNLMELVSNALYGGELCVIWYGNINEVRGFQDEDEGKTIRFLKGFHLCIMDRVKGSGHDVTFEFELKATFKRKNVWLDKIASGYSYAFDVCGLYLPDYEESTVIVNKEIDKNKAFVKLIINKKNKSELDKIKYDEWDRIKKETGKCSSQDPRYASHNYKYHNEPMFCRHECEVCHRVIID